MPGVGREPGSPRRRRLRGPRHERVEERAGWRALRASDFDVVVIYRLDRLARNFLQFWDTVKDLQDDGRTLASVSESLALSSPAGKIVASVLARVPEMTRQDISERVAATRQHLIQQGRVVGGKVPWGYRSVDKPAGKGKVLEQDPGAVQWLREVVRRTREGNTVYSTSQWLTEQGVPTPAGRSETWQLSTVERVLRHPVLAGMTPFNPGRVGEKTRGDDVLRDGDGLPLVDAGLARHDGPGLARDGAAVRRPRLPAGRGHGHSATRPRRCCPA